MFFSNQNRFDIDVPSLRNKLKVSDAPDPRTSSLP
jgi:hypothetical protein